MKLFRPRLRRAHLIAVLLFAAINAGSAQAATPSSGTISYRSTPVTWSSSSPLTGSAISRRQITCNAQPTACDNFTLTIDTTKHGVIDPNAIVDISITPSGVGDAALILYAPGCSPAVTLASPCYGVFGHHAVLLNPQNGVWTVQVACRDCVSVTYTAQATITNRGLTLPAKGANFGWVTSQLPNFADGSTPDYGEPGISINKNGNVIVNTFGPTVWTSTNSGLTFSPAFNLLNQDTLCLDGSGDADAVVANDNTFYADNLCVGGPGGGNVDSFTNRVAGAPPSGWTGPYLAGADVDREWYAADPNNTGVIYTSWHDLAGPNINILKSTDYGQTWFCPETGIVGATACPVTATLNGNDPNSGYIDTAQGNVQSRALIDPTNSNRIYLPYADNNAVASATAPPTNNDFDITRVRVAVSTDGGATWSADTNPTGAPVLDANKAFPYDGVHDNVVAHDFPMGAIDTAGNLYIVFSLRLGTSTQSHLYLMASTDHGLTWTGPTQIDSGTGSNIYPWLVAGDPGRIGISWYGSTSNDFDDTGAAWSEMFSQSLNALSATPTFSQSNVSGSVPMHLGDICEAGTLCLATGGNRDLADFQGIAVDPCGNAHPVWTDDHNGQGVTVTARQTKGFGLYANKTC